MEKMQTQQQEREIVWGFLDKASVKFRDSDANEKLLLDTCERPVDYDSVTTAFSKIQHQLAPGRAYVEAYQGLFAARPELRVEANVALLDSLWNLDWDMSADGLIALANHKDVRDRLCRTQEYVEAQKRSQHRAALIQAISLGKSTYSYPGNNDGRICNENSGHLASETDERLQEILGIVTEYRRLSSMSVDEIKKQRRLDEIARGRVQNLSLPSHWIPDRDGQNRNTGIQIKAGVQVELSADVIKRLHRDDLVKLTRSYGADLVNARLGVKPPIQYGNVVQTNFTGLKG